MGKSGKNFTPEFNVFKANESKVPYAGHLGETAELIAEDTVAAIPKGRMSGIEAAGRFSMSTLLTAVADGKISLKDAFPFLKSLAEKKTPDPVVQIEQHQTIDLRAILVEAVEKNAAAMEKTVGLALSSRQAIQDRLDCHDASLQLSKLSTSETLKSNDPTDEDYDPSPDDDASETESVAIELRAMDWRPGDPPPEVKALSARRR